MSAPVWPPVDAENPVSLPTIVSSSDLFDGELFGDELIDIYNSTVGGHANGQEIPELLAPPEADTDGMLTAVGDGFGAFRPSTSFNDLGDLLAATEAEASATKPTAGAAAAAAEAQSSNKKRNSPVVTSSCPKRTAVADAEGRRVSLPKATAAVVAKRAPIAKTPSKITSALMKPGKKANTPNPLTMAAAAASTAICAKVVAKALAPMPPVPPAVPSAPIAAVHKTTAGAPSKQEEAEFKTIAQAAVSSLIMSAGSSGDQVTKFSSTKEKVDVSTAHIKALTGNNWVAACAGVTQDIVVDNSVNSKDGNRNRRQNLTPDERARQNRDRNREHARNTRLRKKAYVEELKRTLSELVSQRDAAEFEKRQAAQRELEQREVRFRVIEEFLKLRGRNETNFARWAAILEDGFSLTLPTTDLHSLVQEKVPPGHEQVLSGVSDVMGDAAVFSTFLQTLASGEGVVSCQYQCERKNFFMDGCQAVLEWQATSIGAVNKGASAELSFKGIIRGKFSPASNKLLSASISYDTGSMLLQLQKISGAVAAIKTEPGHTSDAQAAASQADAILDSLQMPCLPSKVPSAVIVDASSSSSEGSCDKGGLDSDESVSEAGEKESTRAISA